jgi:acetylornithine deacetylase/succinyl-diaminopimelate desuccinylase-like protein
MDLDRWIQNTLQIQSIPAPTFSETQRAGNLRDSLLAAGLSNVELDELGNVYAHIKGGEAPALIISAHLDTVFPHQTDLTSSQSEHQLRGPGVGDNSVALAALIELAHDLPSSELAGDVWLVANVGEEGLGNLRGMQRVVDRFSDDVGAYIVLEGMVLGHIYHRGLPVKRLRIRAITPGGHSWIHAGRPSAINTMIALGQELTALPLPDDPRTTLNIGSIQGGTTINTIASECHIEIDLRSEDSKELQGLVRRIERIARSHRSRSVEIEVESIGERPGGGIPSHHPLVEAAHQALVDTGEEKIFLQTGSTDASVPLSRNIPAVCVGLTRGRDAHSLEECIEIDPLPRGYAALLDLIHAAFSIPLNR